jgi:hypothetical protein
MTRLTNEGGASSPSQTVRLLWFLSFFFAPMGAIAYVSTYGVKDGNEAALIHVLLILAASLTVSVVCAIAQPIQILDDALTKNAGRANLALAIFDTVLVVLLISDPFAAGHACEFASSCRTYPVGWVALAGMHYCYVAWAYITLLVSSRQ